MVSRDYPDDPRTFISMIQCFMVKEKKNGYSTEVKFAKSSKIPKPGYICNKLQISTIKQWDLYNQRRPQSTLFDPKEL